MIAWHSWGINLNEVKSAWGPVLVWHVQESPE
jgi:hypothetical protein